METVNPHTGEITKHKVKGLWAPFPIRAYDALGNAGHFHAQRILMCLVRHLGRNSREVFPSYDTIQELSGVHRNRIREGLDILIEFGFIKVSQRKSTKWRRNNYELFDKLTEEHHFNEVARSHLPKPFYCVDCKKPLLHGDTGPLGKVSRTHYGCGGTVIAMESKLKASARTKAILNACADEVLVPTSSTDSGQS